MALSNNHSQRNKDFILFFNILPIVCNPRRITFRYFSLVTVSQFICKQSFRVW